MPPKPKLVVHPKVVVQGPSGTCTFDALPEGVRITSVIHVPNLSPDLPPYYSWSTSHAYVPWDEWRRAFHELTTLGLSKEVPDADDHK